MFPELPVRRAAASFECVADLHGGALRHEMGIQGEAAIPHVDNDAVTAGSLERDVRRGLQRCLVGEVPDHSNDSTGGGGQDIGTIVRVVFEAGAVARIGGILRVNWMMSMANISEGMEASVNRIQRRAMGADLPAAAVYVDPALTF